MTITRNERLREAAVYVVVFLVLAFTLGSWYRINKACTARNGVVVRGAVWFECVDRK